MIRKYFLFAALLFSTCGFGQTVTTSISTTITIWKDSAMGAIYNKATASVAYGKKDKKGYYKIFISDTLGRREKQVTYPGWKADRHQWAEEWSPDGKYLFC